MSKPVKAVPYILVGTAGPDTLGYLAGVPSLNGSPHAVTSGATQITLSGGDGNDTIVTDSAYGTAQLPLFFDGGTGTDTLDLSNLSQGVWVRLASSTRHGASPSVIATQFTLDSMNVNGGDANDPNALVTSAADGHNNVSNIESLVGTAYNDVLELGLNAGTADGGAGNDRVIGGIANDMLIGGAGDDFLFGKGGNDVMTGGTGADQFEVVSLNGNDVITDFHPGEGDQLFYGWQQSSDTIPDASSWHSSSWADGQGTVHQSITADFTGGSVTLVDLTMADVTNVMAHMTDFHYLNG